MRKNRLYWRERFKQQFYSAPKGQKGGSIIDLLVQAYQEGVEDAEQINKERLKAFLHAGGVTVKYIPPKKKHKCILVFYNEYRREVRREEVEVIEGENIPAVFKPGEFSMRVSHTGF